MNKNFANFYFLILGLLTHQFLYAQCPNLVWSDEFEGNALDLTKWETQLGDGCAQNLCGWGNNELQYYKSSNAEVSNGTLKIIARKEKEGEYQYTSARIRTKGLADFTHGRFEARIKLPVGQGIWPAFWMLSTNQPFGGWPQSGEIDIMESLGQHPEKIFGTTHFGETWPGNRFKSSDVTKFDGSTFADDFHVYAVEWENDELRWYLDDVLYQILTKKDFIPSKWPFTSDNQMHFLLNVAVGGMLPGNPDETTPFPSQMEVDYVRVYDGVFNPSIWGALLVENRAKGVSYSIHNGENASSYNWSVPSEAKIISGQGSSEILVDWGAEGGTIRCEVETSCFDQSLEIDVFVEPEYVFSSSLENFDSESSFELITANANVTEIKNPKQSEMNPSDLVAKYIRNQGVKYDLLSFKTSAISDAKSYADRSHKFFMDVLTEAPMGTEIIIQLENSKEAQAENYPKGRHSRYVGMTTKSGEWDRVVFNLLDEPDGITDPTTIDQITILFAANSFTGDTYFWDNLHIYEAEEKK